jgi:hypothetical protein
MDFKSLAQEKHQVLVELVPQFERAFVVNVAREGECLPLPDSKGY